MWWMQVFEVPWTYKKAGKFRAAWLVGPKKPLETQQGYRHHVFQG
jgi:hypothetical protein